MEASNERNNVSYEGSYRVFRHPDMNAGKGQDPRRVAVETALRKVEEWCGPNKKPINQR